MAEQRSPESCFGDVDSLESLFDDLSPLMEEMEAAEPEPMEDASCPEFEDALCQEVDEYRSTLQKKKVNRSLQCVLCPFRRFDRKSALVKHLDYHKAPYYTAGAAAKTHKLLHQHDLAKAMWRKEAMGSVLRPKPTENKFLARSAEQIRKWNAALKAEEIQALGRCNEVDLAKIRLMDKILENFEQTAF